MSKIAIQPFELSEKCYICKKLIQKGEYIDECENALKLLLKEWGTGFMTIEKEIAIVSAVGVGMKSHGGIAAKMFSAFAKEGINIDMISTSEIKISCVIETAAGEKALKLLHKVFELEKAN